MINLKLEETLIKYLSELDVEFTDKDIDKVFKYLSLVYNYNQNKNIIGTKDISEIFYRHFLDSLSVFSLKETFNQNIMSEKYILDLGSGAGLPGILIAIFLKDSNIVLLDKNTKKSDFLKSASYELGLNNISVISKPAEELGRENRYREKFDFCLARAVSKIEILVELIIPFCKINGKIILFKSSKVFEEAGRIKSFTKKLGIENQDILETKVPELDEYRAFIVMEKNKKTPASFPRNYSIIKRESDLLNREDRR